MTSQSPAQCFACSRLADVRNPTTGTRLVARCTAYPNGIPEAIGMDLADHRMPRGDEVNGLVFDRAAGPEADDAWKWWERTAQVRLP